LKEVRSGKRNGCTLPFVSSEHDAIPVIEARVETGSTIAAAREYGQRGVDMGKVNSGPRRPTLVAND
jgi:hypothetical protein